jgi:hypothetical protein
MRQAKPDDVSTFVSLGEIRDLWPDLTGHLGRGPVVSFTRVPAVG